MLYMLYTHKYYSTILAHSYPRGTRPSRTDPGSCPPIRTRRPPGNHRATAGRPRPAAARDSTPGAALQVSRALPLGRRPPPERACTCVEIKFQAPSSHHVSVTVPARWRGGSRKSLINLAHWLVSTQARAGPSTRPSDSARGRTCRPRRTSRLTTAPRSTPAATYK